MYCATVSSSERARFRPHRSHLLLAAIASITFFSIPLLAGVTFTETTIASGQTNSYSIVSGDFNKDGILDLVTVNRSSVSFYKGLGGGTYAAPINFTLPLNQGGYGRIVAADLNADGKLDVAIAWGNQCCGTPFGGVTILLGNGDGTFNQGTNIAVSNAADIGLADFNGDHKPDIAVSDNYGNGSTWIYLGNGNGTFTLSNTQPYGGFPMVVGDFNADGKQDVLYAGGVGAGLLLGNGDGILSAPIVNSTLAQFYSLAVGDFYNNRIQTAVGLTTDYNGNTGGDTYLYSLRYSNSQLIIENQNLVMQFLGGAAPLANVAGGDLNGDFKFDVFLSGGDIYSAGSTGYMLGNGNGTFQPLQNAPSSQYVSYQSPVIRDLNLDSRQDVGLAWNNIQTVTAGAEQLLNTNSATNCNPPPANKLSVKICAPSSGQTVSRTFTFKAAGNAFNGIAKRMELWIDGKKIGQNLEDQLKITTTLSAGKHTASFVVVDTFDNHTSSAVSFTAN